MGTCEVALIADYTFYQVYGDDSARAMQRMFDFAAAALAVQTNVEFKAVATEVISDPNHPTQLGQLATVQNKDVPLDRLQLGLASNSFASLGSRRYCLVHMFTALPQKFESLGTSFRPGLCRIGGYNSGYSILQRNNQGKMNEALMQATIAHEVAHGMGAYHDETNGRCDPRSNAKRFMMWPYVSLVSKNVEILSECAREDIRNQIEGLRSWGALCLNGIYPDIDLSGFNVSPVSQVGAYIDNQGSRLVPALFSTLSAVAACFLLL
jgi:hypothetical protein